MLFWQSYVFWRAGPLKQVWSFPFFESHLIRVDWLHCVDKGVANFFIAGLFDLYLRDRAHGETVARKLLQLWRHLQVYYKGNQVQDRLNVLKESMLKTNGTPEISCSASELRALVPFSLCLVDDWVEPLSEEKRLAQRAMRHLACCYDCLSDDMADAVAVGVLEECAFGFHEDLVQLNALRPARWTLRPKIHQFLELSLERTPPSRSWTYRDESYGGDLAQQAHHRGGICTALSMSRNALSRFVARERVPRLGLDG